MSRDDVSTKEFIDILAAAMLDAAAEGKCSQLQTTITPPGKRATLIRIILVPEEMDWVRGAEGGEFRRPT